ncbi:MAG: glycosyl hydrolase [Chloroflexota bacterium]
MTESYDLNGLLEWRCIGPFRGGRVVTVAGDPSDQTTFYFGACAGGVWKTTDGGLYWENVSDGYFNTAPVGALAVAESDPNVIYAGTGEATIRIDVSHGDGVYKSTDAGETWAHIGLTDTRFISKVRIHPQNPDIVYVAALGHAFGPNEERGVFRSTDGGKNWERVLFQSERAGSIDLTIDPQNPRILYTTIWQGYRNFWNISSGGPESRIYKSTDGGDSWVDITENQGLPKGPLGKMAIVASPAQSGRVFALIEAKEHGLYRSDNGGRSWTRVNDRRELVDRAWYFTHLTADTQDPDTLYVNNLSFWKSIDAGKSFVSIDTPHGDNHDLWIDPNDSRRMIQGNDGGANVSFNGGASWSNILNQPTAQFYHLDTDNQYPYRVYGTQQDNTSISVPSRSDQGVIPWADCYIAGTGESGYIAAHPEDSNIVYVGAIGSSPGGGNALQRYDHHTKQIRLITTWPASNEGYGASEEKYRFAWTYPILFSPHDSNVLYAAGNQVFKTTDEGQSWQIISPDLTRADPETLKPTGGPINLDSIGAETYATVFAFIESQHEPGVFWAGSDDGLIHISKDGGENWQNVTPSDLPEWTMIQIIEQSSFDPATVYVAASRHKMDDYQPYLYKTTDYGQSWQKITSGIPDDAFTRVIREDPSRQGLLYAGTETGLYISYDAGASWHNFQLNLPICPIYDLKIKENDLVAATHGRAFWILDDITPLHQLSDEVLANPAHLFAPRTTVRSVPVWYDSEGKPGKNYAIGFGSITPYLETKTPENTLKRRFLDAGQNPPYGVIITYHLQDTPDEPVTLTLLTETGDEINAFTSKPGPDSDAKSDKETLYLPTQPGMNRFIWPMRYSDGTKVKGDEKTAIKPRGPVVPPGNYQAQLKVGDQVQTVSFNLIKDPRVETSQEDFQAQFDLLMGIRQKLSEINQAINQIRDVKSQIEGWVKRAIGKADQVIEVAKPLVEKLSAQEEKFIKPGMQTDWESYNHGARLGAKMSSLIGVVASADFAPTTQSVAVFEELVTEIDAELANLQTLLDTDLAAFNQTVSKSDLDAVIG